jgi:hypothetical protein
VAVNALLASQEEPWVEACLLSDSRIPPVHELSVLPSVTSSSTRTKVSAAPPSMLLHIVEGGNRGLRNRLSVDSEL